jgi:hypothetical protein
MTGRIKTLSFGSTSGLIEAENRLRVPFELAAVLAYDAGHLCAGQLVTFVMENGRAANVCIQKAPQTPRDEKTRKEGVFRYLGFDQAKAVRTFRFERTSQGETAELFAVSTDLALFAKYHVTFQEGPALCLRLLMAGLDAAEIPLFQRALTEEDLITHVASRPGPGARSYKRPPRPAPAHAV